MSCTARALRLLALTALLGYLNAGQGSAQAPLPAAPIPVDPAASAPGASTAPIPPPAPPATLLPPPPPSMVVPPPPPATQPLGYGQPSRGHDMPLDDGSMPGWFGEAEIGLVKPHIRNQLSADVSFVFGSAIWTDTVSLPSGPLDWTVAPRLVLGYRLPDHFGEILLSYRLLLSEGRATILDYDFFGDGLLRNRLDLQAFDLDYATSDLMLTPQWGLKGRIGIRLANVFFDSRAVGPILEQRISNHFIGAGPHLGLDLWRRLDATGLSLLARLEGAVPLGRNRQSFEETWVLDDVSLVGGATNLSGSQAVPTLNFQIGLSWVPLVDSCLRFSLGYQCEAWWSVGRVGDSRANLYDQGLFFRGECKF